VSIPLPIRRIGANQLVESVNREGSEILPIALVTFVTTRRRTEATLVKGATRVRPPEQPSGLRGLLAKGR